jgi:hypothetical protein
MPNSNDGSARNEAISKRAYELYLQRGSVSGHELDDWLEAEAELSRADADETPNATPVQPVVRRRSNRGDAHPPSNRRV